MNKNIVKYIKIILFIIMLILIYLVSPKLTASIQNCAKYLYELDSNYITRVVELILAVSLVIVVMNTKPMRKGGKSYGKS